MLFWKRDKLPRDADGDAISRLRKDGSSLDKPMTVDFQIAAPDEPSANRIAAACAKLNYDVSVHQDHEEPAWTVECTTRMLVTHAAVVAVQSQLDAIARPFGGYADGWGSFGNADE